MLLRCYRSELTEDAVPGTLSGGPSHRANPQHSTDVHRLSAYLIETDPTNAIITDSAYATLQFWHTVPLALSPVPGCSLLSLTLNPSPSDECTYDDSDPGIDLYYDCSSYSAGGALALSAVTQNSSWYQTYVSLTCTKHTTH
jgi:hypothetical protein